MDTVDPWWFLIFGFISFSLVLTGLSPLRDNGEMSSLDIIILWTRKSLLVAKASMIILFVGFILVGLKLFSSDFFDPLLSMIAKWWLYLIACIIVGAYSKFMFQRYLKPKLSELLKSFRVNQETDELSDIEVEITKNKAISHVPENYEKEGFIFTGLNMNKEPQYIPIDVWIETHKSVIGATRYGKGLTYQVWSQQSIKLGHSVFMINPKEDKFLPKIVEQEARKAGRRFIHLDLREQGNGKWSPFAGGSAQDRRTRFYAIMNMLATGTNADHYKSLAREVAFSVFKEGENLSLESIYKAIKSNTKNEDNEKACSTVRADLQEWMERKTLNPNRKGFSIERSLLENAVVYVQGDLDDHIVKSATTAFVIELIQEAKRLKNERENHLSAYIDELRFLVSKPVFDALATIAGADVDLTVAFQNFGDLLNPDDKSLDGRALLAAIQTNCQVKMIFKVDDKDTAEFASESSGTVQKKSVKFERTEVNRSGGEEWQNNRMIGETEEALIHDNTIRVLPKKVAAFYRPDHLAEIISVDAVPLEEQPSKDNTQAAE
ncbi:hypothetical protein WH95_19505 [Kiloniella litopenaei]|uniref:TraD/TraG TraM recognition site domain-containing protein n=2 Tax=Kiloniella litopenaei TaxID=1549748 RepID=A0A0M2R0T3_9PROT|nr:hypothetical protein WH95_19505 [Kiloniella litopenaei]